MESNDEIEHHPNNLKCKNCIFYKDCYHTIYRDGELDFCCYEKSRFSTKPIIKKEDILDKAIRRIQNERPPWGEDKS